MIKNNREVVKAEGIAGGAGYILRDRLLEDELAGTGACTMFAQITLDPGCEIGTHSHVGDSEAYFITSGTAEYEDNGTTYPVQAGDLTYCVDGDSHAIRNKGSEPMSFVALIMASA